MSLKYSDIIKNDFVNRLRMELVIDSNEYNKLCGLLRSLAVEWRHELLVDKRIVQELYVLPTIVRGVASVFAASNPSRAAEIEDLAIELDALILECLSDDVADDVA